jgi:hypothetical protein
MGWLSRTAARLACAVLVAATACGTERAPDSAGQTPADLYVHCGKALFHDIPADLSEFPPLDQASDPVTGFGAEHEFFDRRDWFVASRPDSQLILFGVGHRQIGVPDYGWAVLTRRGAGWEPGGGFGGCDLNVTAPGFNSATFVLDPKVKPDPARTSISVLAWEHGCADGRPPEGRQVRPVVLSADEGSVSIVVLVQPDPTPREICPYNPSFPLEIELGAPLGDRVVFDASFQPARERLWPPPPSSDEVVMRNAKLYPPH